MELPYYEPTEYIPIHEVRDWCYVRKIIRAARRGEHIPGFVVYAGSLLTGTHRCAANEIMQLLYNGRRMSPEPVLIEAIDLDDLDLDPRIREKIDDALEYSHFDGDNFQKWLSPN